MLANRKEVIGAIRDLGRILPQHYCLVKHGNGKMEGVQDDVKGLLNTLWKAMEAKGVTKQQTGYSYATLPRGADGKVDSKLSAWFNFRLVYGVMWGTDTGNGNEGKAQAMHNFKRSVALLQLSFKDLTGADIAGATLMK